MSNFILKIVTNFILNILPNFILKIMTNIITKNLCNFISINQLFVRIIRWVANGLNPEKGVNIH